MRLLRLPAAEADLEDIWNYIAADNSVAAERVLRRINEAEMRLLEHPRIGQERPDLRPGLRHWPVGNYLIIYRIDPGAITVVRVLHGSRDLPALLGD
jgi:toxin ParE1/3/4